MDNKLPAIGITMGDPSGVGPEIAVKAFAEAEVYKICNPILIGDASVIKRIVNDINGKLIINRISSLDEAYFTHDTMDVLDLNNIDGQSVEYGKISKDCGAAAYEYIHKAITLAMDGKLDATVTGPIHKKSLNMAGIPYSGHTEIYAKLTGTKNYAMMLVHGDLRVSHVSTHVSLRQACDRAKKDRILQVIMLTNEAMIKLGIKNPRLGVAGLNPHSGDEGLFGVEEIKEIKPAIKDAKNKGINAEGPIPPDTIFSKAISGQYDAVVAMYHDQGHIPVKLAGFTLCEGQRASVGGINVTLGLPIIRTSVDHGVAFDIAGKGIASPDSLIDAIKYAAYLGA